MREKTIRFLRVIAGFIVSTIVFIPIVAIAYDLTNLLNIFTFVPSQIDLTSAAPTAAALISVALCGGIFLAISGTNCPLFAIYAFFIWMIFLAAVTSYVAFVNTDVPIVWYFVLSCGLNIWFMADSTKKKRKERQQTNVL